jgi:hypothetical protein
MARMAGTNIEAWGPLAGEPAPFHTSFHPSHSLSSAPLRELRKSGEPPVEILNADISILPPQAGFLILIT